MRELSIFSQVLSTKRWYCTSKMSCCLLWCTYLLVWTWTHEMSCFFFFSQPTYLGLVTHETFQDIGSQLADNQFCTWSLTHLHHSGHAYMVTWPRSRESWEWVFKTYTEYSFNIIKDLIMTCIYWKHGWTQINTRISIIVNTQIKSQISDGGDIYFYSEASE